MHSKNKIKKDNTTENERTNDWGELMEEGRKEREREGKGKEMVVCRQDSPVPESVITGITGMAGIGGVGGARVILGPDYPQLGLDW